MAGHGSKMARKQDEAILALLTHKSVEEAAQAVGIPPRTLYRWVSDPVFDKAYRAARRQFFSQQIGRLQYAAPAAVATLLKMMLDPNTPASTKVRAADSVLDHSAKAIEIEDIEVRVAELERAAEAS